MDISPPLSADNWSRRTIDFLAPYFTATARTVRVSTGFFTIQAYDLIRGYLASKQVSILIGYDEAVQALLRARLVTAVMEHLSQWDAEDRRAAVDDLVGKLSRGEIQFVEQSPADSLETRMRRKDHAKLFLFDDDRVVVGSANLTVTGLMFNTEAVAAVEEPERIAYWRWQYESVHWRAAVTRARSSGNIPYFHIRDGINGDMLHIINFGVFIHVDKNIKRPRISRNVGIIHHLRSKPDIFF